MRKILFTIFIATSLFSSAQVVQGIRGEFRDSVTSLTNNTDLVLIGLGTGGVNIEGEYTLPKTDGTANQVFKTDGAGNIVFDNVSFSEIEGTDTVLTISDTVSTLATQFDLTQIQGYTVANSANNRVITSVDSENGNAETNLTFDGTDLNIVSGGLQIGGTEVISSGRAISGVAGNFTSNVGVATSANPSDFGGNAGNNLLVGSGSGNQGITVYSGATGLGILNFADGMTSPATFAGRLFYDHSTDAIKLSAGGVSSSGAQFSMNTTGVTLSGSLTAGATTVSSFTNSGVAGTGERLKTATSTGEETTIANGTDGQVMTMVSGSPAWADSPFESGAYEPVFSDSTNISSISNTTGGLNYFRVDDMVTVFGVILIDPINGSNTTTDYYMTLPISSNFTQSNQAAGTHVRVTTDLGNVSSDATTDGVFIQWLASNVAFQNYWIYFSYRIL